MANKPGRLSDGMQLSGPREARVDAFAPYVSVLPWFNVDVLHKLYLNIFKDKHEDLTTSTEEYTEYDLRTITSADFLQSPQVTRIDYNVFVIDTELREALRNELKEEQGIMKNLGEFMLAYADQCQGHFLSTRYVEVFRIEGNLIVNPAAEAGRIAQHIAQQLNSKGELSKMEPSIAYFLKMLDQGDQGDQDIGTEALTTLLKGMTHYINNNKAKATEVWEKLQGKEGGGNSISIKLPADARKIILNNIEESKLQVQERVGGRRVFAVIVGIDDYDGSLDNLTACVSSARQVDQLLKRMAENNAATEYHSVLLLSKNENIAHRPTRKNIIQAFSHFKKARADRGDVCLFYFAGYGAKVSLSDVLNTENDNSALVCSDSRGEGGFDLLDVEVSYLFWEATHKEYSKVNTGIGLHILHVLDCPRADGFSQKTTFRHSKEIHQHLWQKESNKRRGVDDIHGYLEVTSNVGKDKSFIDYTKALKEWESIPKVFLIGSNTGRAVMETIVDGEKHVLFTWALIKELKENKGWKLTYHELIKRLNENVKEKHKKQNPILSMSGLKINQQRFLGGVFIEKEEAKQTSNWQDLADHTAPILSVAYSHDGQFALTGSEDGTAKVWDTKYGYCLLTLKGHTDAINSMAHHPKKDYVLTGSADHSAKLWDRYTGECLHTYVGHSGSVRSVAFSPDGEVVATSSEDRTHKLWAIEGNLIKSVDHTSPVNCVAFSTDGKAVFTGNEQIDYAKNKNTR